MKELSAILDYLTGPHAGEGHVLATLISVEGSSYRRAGARLLVTAQGEAIGSISGGCLEEDLLAHGAEVAKSGRSKLVVYDTTAENELAWGVGLGCHGVVQILLEKLPPQPAWATSLTANLKAGRDTELTVISSGAKATIAPASPATSLGDGTYLASMLPEPDASQSVFTQVIQSPQPLIIFGAGNDAIPLVNLAKELGWHVTVADPRAAYLTPARFPSADKLMSGTASSLVGRLQPGPRTMAVVMTHHYIHDVPIISDLLTLPLAYLGLLGPRKRAAKILADLADAHPAIAPDQLARIHAPVGLDLGAETPQEVALSIMAEMLAVSAGRDGRPLRERRLPIHA